MAPQSRIAKQEWRSATSIGRWRLRNFKSVREADVPLSPLTLLVGANSAGKSTLLQSILAVVQASSTPGNRFPLNGGTVRLGTVKQNRYAGPCEVPPETIDIGGQFLIDGRAGDNRAYAFRRFRATKLDSGEAAMDWAVRLGEPRTRPGGPARIESVNAVVHYQAQDPADAVNHQGPASLQVTSKQDAAGDADAFVLRGSYTTDTETREIRSTTLDGGFPKEAFVVGPRAPRLWRVWQDIYFMMNREGRQDHQAPVEPANDPAQQVVEDIKRAYEPFRADDQDGVDVAGPFRAELYELASARRAPSMRLDPNLVMDGDLNAAVIDKLNADGYDGTNVEHDNLKDISPCADRALEFMRSHVRYLGPLRDDPRVVYQDSPESGNGYVGTKGEFSAAVLQKNGNNRLHVPMPEGKLGATRLVTLNHAVNAWAAFLELGRGFATTDEGRLGLQVQVTQEDVNIPLDLTSVGTGVSQVLPVLVMCLQASSGSLLMIEQPELHLNPRVQQKLADFLIAVASTGRQLIVETHSEYLISRLRLRVAQDPTDTIQRNVGFLFAERDHGCTHYREVAPNAYGGLENWPENFFDQGADDAQKILRAAVTKRRSRSASRHD